MGRDPVSACGNNHGPPITKMQTHVPSRQLHFPQTPSALVYCLHKDYTEEGNLKIYPQHSPRRPFFTFYYHHPCLAQMRRLAVRSSATQGIPVNWWTHLHVHEVHSSVCWRLFFRVFYHPPHCFLLGARLNKMAQCAIIPDRSIIASNFPKWEEKGSHRNLIFFRTSCFNLLMFLKESPV